MSTRTALLIVSAALAPVASAQSTAQAPRAASITADATGLPMLPTLRAHRLSSTIKVDGKLDEVAWAGAQAGTNFVQMDPDNGKLATEQTEVRVLFDDDALYIGARMFDSEPSKIRARLGRRDEALQNADLVEFSFDSYHNRVDGYIFRVTPAGAIRDAAVLAGGGQDNSWDAVWESAARIDSVGWTVELRIPFSQLRYSPSVGSQTWGMQVGRVVSRKNESSQLAFTPRHATGGPARWGTLTELQNLPRARHMELLPYVTTRAEYLHVAPGNPFRDASEYRLNGGADLKYGISSSVTLSATVNPDFGQVEVDPARVNLSANELFFPERRPFFVEGADLFRYGRIRSFNNRGMPTIFHSRRIGRAPQRNVREEYTDVPSEATIAGAMKLTGRSRHGLSGGVLNAVTLRETADFQTSTGVRGSEPVEPLTNYLAARARQELNGGRTQVGVIATAVNRDLSDEPLAGLLRREAYVTGADFNHEFGGRAYSLDASLSASRVAGSAAAIASTQRSPVHYLQRPDLRADTYDPTRTSLGGYAWQLATAKNSGKHTIGSLAWQGVSPGFEVNDIGFQSRSAEHGFSTVLGWKRDEPTRYLRNFLIGPFSGHNWNFDGNLIDNYVGWHVDGRLPNFWNFNVNAMRVSPTYDDRLTRGGPLARSPGRKSMEFFLGSDQRRIWSFEAGGDIGRSDAGAKEHNVWTSFTIRPHSALRVSLSPSYSNALFTHQYLTQAADPTADGTYDRRYVFGELKYNELALETRVDWTFSPKLSLQVFAQPLVADGEYTKFRSLARARTFEFLEHTEAEGTLIRDASGWSVRGTDPAAPTIALGERNFSSRAVVGNAVMRWEYRPGSALFLVWQQRRSGEDAVTGFRFGRDVRGAFDDRPENVFAVKATYWIGS